MIHRQSLADDIMAALLRANEEMDSEVAEHLLQALEVRVQREEAEGQASEAYLQLVRSLGANDVKH